MNVIISILLTIFMGLFAYFTFILANQKKK